MPHPGGHPLPQPPNQLQAALADRYRLERELGQGGMATVYLAHDLKHEREVALKVLRPELAAVLGRERFLNEIRLTAKLDHPHILTLIDSGESAAGPGDPGPYLWYVLPYVRGESLRDRLLRERQLPVEDALVIARQVAGALEYAHRRGVIHRDIKPENILLHEGEAMLTDFGIALAVKEAGGPRLTETGLSLGTPLYMSPEQATGERALDARSDVFSLAAVVYEMLAGEPPHTGPSAQAIISRLLLQPPTPLRVLRSTVPPGIEAAVLKALSVLPADRFPSAAAFAGALSLPARDPGATAGEARPRADRQRQALLLGGMAVVAAAVVVAATLALRSTERATVQPIQLTTSGHAYAPVLAPDGSQVAYAAEECRSETECSYSLMVRETASQAERPIITGLSTLFPFQWSRDGLWLLYNGGDSERPIGLYVVSRLGGPPTYLNDGVANFLGSGDTVVTRDAAVGRPGEPIYLQLRVAPWNHAFDSIRVVPPAGGYAIGAVRMTTSGRRMALAWRDPLGTRDLLTLNDRSGRRTDSLPVAYGVTYLRWAAGEQAILLPLAYAGGSGVAEGRLLRVAVSAAGRFGRRDTLVIAPGVASTAIYDLSTDARSFVFQSTRTGETRISTWVDRGSAPPAGPEAVASSSREMPAEVTRDGHIVYARTVAAGTADAVQWMIAPFDSGAGRAMTPPLRDMRDYTVTDRQLIVATGPARGPLVLTAYDLADGKSTHLADLKELNGTLRSGPRDRLVVVSDVGDSVRLLDARGQEIWRIGVPDSLGRVALFLPAPDGSELVAMTQPVSLVAGPDGNVGIPVLRISAASGALRVADWIRLQNFTTYVWSNDDWLHFGMQRAGESEFRHFRVRPGGGAPQLVGRVPPGACSLAGDARRWACVRTEHLSDIYLLRLPHALR